MIAQDLWDKNSGGISRNIFCFWKRQQGWNPLALRRRKGRGHYCYDVAIFFGRYP